MYLVSKYWDCGDKIMFYIGMGTSCLMGASLPAFCFFFGKLIDGTGEQDHATDRNAFDGLDSSALYMVLGGVILWTISGSQIVMLSLFAEN